VAAVAMGLLGYYAGGRSIFFFVIVMVAPTLLCLRLIDPREIDYDVARGCEPGEEKTELAGGIHELLTDRRLLIFLACAVMFHFANAAMLPLLGEMLGANHGRASMLFMTACVVTTQLVVTALAGPVGRLASSWGRKRLLLIGFAALPVRGILYTLTHNTDLLVAIQLLDADVFVRSPDRIMGEGRDREAWWAQKIDRSARWHGCLQDHERCNPN
jgi:predicted MFS family arabinose efflux permease